MRMKACIDSLAIDRLRSPDVLAAVLGRHAEARGAAGGKLRFACPFHAHKHPERAHLRIEDKPGGAVAICDSYGVVGDVFAVARELEGAQGFLEQVQAVADIAGVRLPDGRGAFGGKRKAGRRRNQGKRIFAHCKPRGGVSAPLAASLSEDDEKAVLEAVKRLEKDPDALAAHAAGLGLPADALLPCTDMECADSGLLGLWPDGRLAYVYGARDSSGCWRPLLAKVRNRPGCSPRFIVWPAGSTLGLWGADGAAGCGTVYVTEGESDALAVRYSVFCLFDCWSSNAPDSFPAADSLPAVVAKPGAGVFKPEWAACLAGKNVVLCADSDAAGLEGARRSAAALHAAGVERVFIWSPPGGIKDARAFYDAARPCRLAEDIISRRESIA